MTREEAIERFNGIINAMSISIAQSKFYPSKAELNELCGMAIEALSADVEIPSDKTVMHIETYRRLYEKYVDLKNNAVKVVRCKDCRHRCKDPIYSKADPHWVIYQIGDCPIICKTVGDDDYCSFGERREPNE